MRDTMLKLSAIFLLAVAVVLTSPDNRANELPRIGILQISEHTSLDEAREGFVERLEELGYVDGENIEINYFNAQGDSSNLQLMSQQLVSSRSDLIFAIATSSAQAIAAETSDIPILTSAVTSLEIAGLVESHERPGTNVSGTSNMAPIRQQLTLLRQLLPHGRTLGVIHNSSEANSAFQAQYAEAVAEELGFETVHMTVTNTNEVSQNFTALAAQVDAVYIPNDNTLASSIATIGQIAREQQLPVITASVGMLRQGGGVATIGVDHFELGRQTADMAVRVFNGEDVSTMPVEFGNEFLTLINEDMAQAIGIHIPAELLGYLE